MIVYLGKDRNTAGSFRHATVSLIGDYFEKLFEKKFYKNDKNEKMFEMLFDLEMTSSDDSAKVLMTSSELLQKVREFNALEGESKRIAFPWIQRTRNYLEAQQV